MMYHCSQLATTIRGEQWFYALNDSYNTITMLGRINYNYYSHTIYLQYILQYYYNTKKINYSLAVYLHVNKLNTILSNSINSLMSSIYYI